MGFRVQGLGFRVWGLACASVDPRLACAFSLVCGRTP